MEETSASPFTTPATIVVPFILITDLDGSPPTQTRHKRARCCECNACRLQEVSSRRRHISTSLILYPPLPCARDGRFQAFLGRTEPGTHAEEVAGIVAAPDGVDCHCLDSPLLKVNKRAIPCSHVCHNPAACRFYFSSYPILLHRVFTQFDVQNHSSVPGATVFPSSMATASSSPGYCIADIQI